MQIILTKPINPPLLREQLLKAFSAWSSSVVELYASEGQITLVVPNSADPAAVQVVIDAHNVTQLTQEQTDELAATDARTHFRNLPDWSTWTPDQAKDYVTTTVLAGQSKAEVDAWIDTNVTTLATAKTALKLLADETIDLRQITSNLAQAVLYLRDVVIRRT
jgi:hypothetical protein